MPEKKNENKPKRRTQVKELPKNEKELSKGEQKKIKGGPQTVSFLPSLGRSEGGSST